MTEELSDYEIGRMFLQGPPRGKDGLLQKITDNPGKFTTRELQQSGKKIKEWLIELANEKKISYDGLFWLPYTKYHEIETNDFLNRPPRLTSKQLLYARIKDHPGEYTTSDILQWRNAKGRSQLEEWMNELVGDGLIVRTESYCWHVIDHTP